ncbi:very long chain fatty acid elongase 4-like [Zophobas morio]|uniref:very long chain fatty acid elongase 4-like n=1 Tax=Zophobas morio TaxID=2755281 RepID=UPI00308286C3
MDITEFCQLVLLQTPLQPVIIVAFYLLFVLKLGPIWMKNRQQFEIKKLLIVYNCLQVFFNAHMFITMMCVLPKLNILCGPIQDSELELHSTLSNVCHKYAALKLFDLLDTAFFILRKSYRQISFLHVYHHTSIFVMGWVNIRYILVNKEYPMGPIIFFGAWNTLVHSVMYTYYLLSINKKYVGQLWWKKCLTLLQLIQHCCMVFMHIVDVPNYKCPIPKQLHLWSLFNFILMVYLFSKFYVDAYCRKKENLDKNVVSEKLATPHVHLE